MAVALHHRRRSLPTLTWGGEGHKTPLRDPMIPAVALLGGADDGRANQTDQAAMALFACS